jgi:hypothetical protein
MRQRQWTSIGTDGERRAALVDDVKAGPGRDIPAESWVGAAWRASVAIVLSVVIFIVIPDRAFTYLSKHVVPLARDAILLTWMVIAFFAMCWLFVRLQSGRRR